MTFDGNKFSNDRCPVEVVGEEEHLLDGFTLNNSKLIYESLLNLRIHV